jgi:hypothetical protein
MQVIGNRIDANHISRKETTVVGKILSIGVCSSLSNKFVGVQRVRLTQRALDAGDSAPSQAVFYASAFFRSDGVPPSVPAPVTPAVSLLLYAERV